jgi:DNA-nicking Smr family endonuclease
MGKGTEMTDDSSHDETGLELPIDGVLDLHTFRPQDVGDLVPAYLEECRSRGIFEVRVIHGKGIGNLKRSVHAILARLPEVESFADASALFGGTGATMVKLRR